MRKRSALSGSKMSRRETLSLLSACYSLPDRLARSADFKDGQDIVGASRGEWWSEAKFGMFLHWGLYSLVGRGEQVMFREHLLPSQYCRLADRFTAPRFDAHEWAGRAAEAGMRYMVLTTKHHDGFCLFNSSVSRFTSAATAAKRDLIAQYVEACRGAGLRVGLYYSLADWHWPVYFTGPKGHQEEFAKFIEYTHTQVQELCTNYGTVDVLWFDGGWPHAASLWQAAKLEQSIRKLQPQVLINDRLPAADHGRSGDFDTSEQRVVPSHGTRRWESCQVTQHYWWGYMAGEQHWKTPTHLIYLMSEIVGRSGNVLLNVGPRGDGSFPPQVIDQLSAIGMFTRRNGEALYGSEGADHLFEFLTTGHMTTRGNTLYLWVQWWQGRELHLCGLQNQIKSARILGHDGSVGIRREGEHIYLTGLPAAIPSLPCTVLALELDGRPAGLPWGKHRLWGDDAAIWADWARS